MGIVSEEVVRVLEANPDIDSGTIRILEFGAGEGSQIPHLQRLGSVVASDVYISGGIEQLTDIEFVQCRIDQAPFTDGQFDVVFSNHVIEHIEDVTGALRELRRIGKKTCIYAFSVPTHVWLVLSIPGQYYDRLSGIGRRIKRWSSKRGGQGTASENDANHFPITGVRTRSGLGRFAALMIPQGHGVTSGFVDCYRNFKIDGWRRLFSENGFSLIKIKPLLLYGPSNWPLIPVMSCKKGLCSSILFLMQKSHGEQSNS